MKPDEEKIPVVKVSGAIAVDELGHPFLMWDATSEDGRLLGAGVIDPDEVEEES